MASLQNQNFLVFNEKRTGTFSFFSEFENTPLLIKNNMAVSGRFLSGEYFCFEIEFYEVSIPHSFKSDESKILHFSGIDERSKIGWEAEFKLGDKYPLVLWRLSLKNLSDSPLFIEKIILLKPKTLAQPNLEIGSPGKGKDLRFFSNGWQSWSYSGAYSANDRMRKSRLGFLQEPMVINPGTPTFSRKGEFSSDFFGVIGDSVSRKGIVIGFLSQVQHFGTIYSSLNEAPQIQIWANGDHTRLCQMDSMTTDWAVLSLCNLDDSNSLSSYLDAVSELHGITEKLNPQTGWCSWYYYYQHISQPIIEENLDVLKKIKQEIPFDLVQIDDGYQKNVGDWLAFDKKFPSGVKGIARSIKQNGFIPGLWTAPFILHPESQTVKDHPDWLLRHKSKRPSRAGFVWNNLGMALDLTVPGVLDHVSNIIETAVHDWGFQYLKLDFLYAAALKGNYHDDTKTRAQVLRSGLETIREAAGKETVLLGCGVPLGSALGLVDSMRIGADVSGHWKPMYFNIGFPFKKEPHMPSAENSINNVIRRSFLHNRWWVNDPDCLLIRDDSALSLSEIQSFATVIAMTGGAVLISDKMAMLSNERLQIVKALIPPINKCAQVIDWLESGLPNRLRIDLEGALGAWQLLSFSNWGDQAIDISLKSKDFGLTDTSYMVSSFWQRRSWLCKKNSPLFLGMVQPHETVLLAVRKYIEGAISYIGSDIHISQGLEVKKIRIDKNRADLWFSQKKQLSGHADLLLPMRPIKVTLNGLAVEWTAGNNKIYRLLLKGEPSLLSIHF